MFSFLDHLPYFYFRIKMNLCPNYHDLHVEGFAEQLQLYQDGMHCCFLLVEFHLLLLSHTFLIFKPLKQIANFTSDHTDRNTSGLERTCYFWETICQVLLVLAFLFLQVTVKRGIWSTCCCWSSPRPHIAVDPFICSGKLIVWRWIRMCHPGVGSPTQPCWLWHWLA